MQFHTHKRHLIDRHTGPTVNIFLADCGSNNSVLKTTNNMKRSKRKLLNKQDKLKQNKTKATPTPSPYPHFQCSIGTEGYGTTTSANHSYKIKRFPGAKNLWFYSVCTSLTAPSRDRAPCCCCWPQHVRVDAGIALRKRACCMNNLWIVLTMPEWRGEG